VKTPARPSNDETHGVAGEVLCQRRRKLVRAKCSSMSAHAGGAYMPLFGMCAISERPAGAGPSAASNGQSRWLLNGARG
jgi:hypothetical protein